MQRQYSRTAGRTENCQIGVFAAYATTRGHALVDRELYLPKSWTDDPEHCRTARIPENRPFATKNELARTLVLRAQVRPLPVTWVAAGATYGQDSRLRRFLEDTNPTYVMAVSKSQQVLAPVSTTSSARPPTRHGSGSPAATAPKGLGSMTGLPPACRRSGSSTATSPPGNAGCLPAAAPPRPTTSPTSSHPRPWTPPSPIAPLHRQLGQSGGWARTRNADLGCLSYHAVISVRNGSEARRELVRSKPLLRYADSSRPPPLAGGRAAAKWSSAWADRSAILVTF
ncbi:transposase [Streptomyces sp. NPDC060322]|uniref:transposase n=1 Tax=Streptomyces sp. NPDC060322 TaxID=3347097 RepID=UPI00366710B3